MFPTLYAFAIVADPNATESHKALAKEFISRVEWWYEDELPDWYPYDAMFPYSRVDFVRLFPAVHESELIAA